MYRGSRILLIAPVWNEELKIGSVIERIPRDVVDEVLVVDDGSDDSSTEVASGLGATVVSLGRTLGVGVAIRTGYRFSMDNGYDIAVVIAGNNKDSPDEIPKLLDPIVEDRADLVQGSRFLADKPSFGPMPAYRKVATRLHPLLFSLVARRKTTDSTNGFRATSMAILKDPRINLDQDWLARYELEPYLYLKAIRLGYRVLEVPVTKIYPAKALGQTKMDPMTDWWRLLSPIFYLGLGLKR
ncbi:MAG: dolichol-phosphate mannosyltransferase [Actinomycetota bacterium]|jgi:dolichol-phosphate mannosyltransferase|nr:dolichol-phosphate mannosyltransferase [Actinomycetota bacterium]